MHRINYQAVARMLAVLALVVAFASGMLAANGNPSEADLDGDVDGHDLRVFLVLLDGRADFDGDLDIDADDWTLFAACLAGPDVPPPGGAGGPCRPGDLDADGDVDLADGGLFQAVFTGQRGGSGAVPANPYLFTGRRLDFDLRDTDGSVTGQPGRPLLVLYDYRAREYDPFHGRFCQRDPAALPDTDVVRLAWRALALEHLHRNLVAAARMGLSQGPARAVSEVLAASLESAGIRVRLGGRHGLTWPASIYARHLDGLILYQYARSNPLLYTDPDGLFSVTELLGSTTIQSGILSGLLAGLSSGIFQGVSQGSWGAFFEGFGIGFAGGFAGGVAVPAFAAGASGLLAKLLSEEIAQFVGVAIANGGGGAIGSALSSALSGQNLEQILADAAFGAFVGFGSSAFGQALGYGAALETSTGGANIGEVIQDISDLFNLVSGLPVAIYFDLLRDYWEGQ